MGPKEWLQLLVLSVLWGGAALSYVCAWIYGRRFKGLPPAVASLIFFRILAVSGVTNVMLVNFLVPVSALLLGGSSSASGQPGQPLPVWP
jgi:hypothetical protein